MRENRFLEFKENIHSNTFLKTISAFANYEGGKIIFGISDDGTVTGITHPEDACLDLENKINDSIKPVPEYSLEIQKDLTIILAVHEGKYKPYLYKGKAYKRSDTATIEVERLEYNRLILEGQNMSFEELKSSKQDLMFSVLEKDFIRIMGIHSLNKDILKTLGLYSDQQGFNNAAALMADENQFPGIDIIRFGESIDEIMDRETIDHVSLLTQIHKSVEMFLKYYQYEKIEGTERKIINKIPEKAFREAVANALVHRLWDVNASIKISMYADKIEINSPGGLPAGISEDEYMNGQISILRNPIIGNIFFRLKYIEKFGTGILRINQAYEHALKKPLFKIYANSIRVVLPVITATDLSPTEKIIVDLIRDRGRVKRSDIEKETQLSKDKIIRMLKNLTGKNIIARKGAGRGVWYEIP